MEQKLLLIELLTNDSYIIGFTRLISTGFLIQSNFKLV